MLSCPACGREFEGGPDEPWRCSCGSYLEFTKGSSPDAGPPAFSELDSRLGLWAFDGFVPVPKRVSLGEGFTPLVDAPGWDAAVKLEYCSPTGSFKDRGAATTLSRAVELGVDRVVEDSSGNAGLAIATYAAHAGIDAEVYVPTDVAPGKRRAIEETGAQVIDVAGSREDVARECVERVERGDAWYASHVWNPAFIAGTATFALELCAQRDWTAPDAVVLPVGHGTLYVGAFRGFLALDRADWIDRVPRLLGAQAAGYAPIVGALRGDDAGATASEDGDANALADGIRIREPVRRADVLHAAETSGGEFVAVDEADTLAALDRLRRGGFGIEPTSAVAPAALLQFRERGVVGPDDDVVVALTGRNGETGNTSR